MFRRVLSALQRMAERKRISRGLRALDDHQLHDLGVHRDQIGAYVRAMAKSADLRAG